MTRPTILQSLTLPISMIFQWFSSPPTTGHRIRLWSIFATTRKRFELTLGPTLQVLYLHLVPLCIRHLQALSTILMINTSSHPNSPSLTTKVRTQRETTRTMNMTTNRSPCRFERGETESRATINNLDMVLISSVVTSTTLITIRMQTMHSNSPSIIRNNIYYGETTALDTYHSKW